jgi:hypothetical protein
MKKTKKQDSLKNSIKEAEKIETLEVEEANLEEKNKLRYIG